MISVIKQLLRGLGSIQCALQLAITGVISYTSKAN